MFIRGGENAGAPLAAIYMVDKLRMVATVYIDRMALLPVVTRSVDTSASGLAGSGQYPICRETCTRQGDHDRPI